MDARILHHLPAIVAALLSLLALVFAAPAWAPPPPPEFVENGSFEDDVLDPWLSVYGPSYVRLVSADVWTPAHGTRSVEVDHHGVLYQDIATTPGQRYSLSFKHAADPVVDPFLSGCAEQGPRPLAVQWDSGLHDAVFDFDTSGRTAADMGWTQRKMLVEASSATTRLTFADELRTLCGVAIDEVSLSTPAADQTGVRLDAAANAWPVFGQPLALTATVLGASAAVTPTGSVQFAIDGVAVGEAVALEGGSAGLEIADLDAGAYRATATYLPDSASFSASSIGRRVAVSAASTETDLVLETSSAPVDQMVTATATVGVFAPGSGTPTGSVQFADELGPLGDPVPLDENATAEIGLLEDLGDHSIYATYSGDGNFLGSSVYAPLNVFDPTPEPEPTPDPAITTRIGTTTTLGAKVPVAPNEAYGVTAVVARAADGGQPLDGTIQFSVAGVAHGPPIPLDADGRAQTTIVAPPSGRQTVSALYSGNSHYSRSIGRFSQRVVTPALANVVTPPADTTPPVFTLTPKAARLGTVLRRGLTVRVGCSEACSGELKLALSRREARRAGLRTRAAALVIGTVEIDVPGARSLDVVVRVDRPRRRALRRARLLRVQLRAALFDVVNNPAARTQRLTLRR